MRLNAPAQNPWPRARGFVQVRAFSKINLILDIVCKRTDGYHNIRSVMQTLALYDTITITAAASHGEYAHDAFILTCDHPNLPIDDSNLVTRAAKFMMQTYDIPRLSIVLEKRIPIAAGLAGGSSNCAATLFGINRLFSLGIPMYDSKCISLMEIGRRFGADVPFCLLGLTGSTALAEGIGDILTPLPPHPHAWVLLASPGIPVATANIFNQHQICERDSNISAMRHALSQGDLYRIAANFGNDLAQTVIKLHPQINDIIFEMKNQGAINAAMSGSGPTVFGYFTSKELAIQAQHELENKLMNIVKWTFLTEIKTKTL